MNFPSWKWCRTFSYCAGPSKPFGAGGQSRHPDFSRNSRSKTFSCIKIVKTCPWKIFKPSYGPAVYWRRHYTSMLFAFGPLLCSHLFPFPLPIKQEPKIVIFTNMKDEMPRMFGWLWQWCANHVHIPDQEIENAYCFLSRNCCTVIWIKTIVFKICIKMPNLRVENCMS